jgi:hypothetical protein
MREIINLAVDEELKTKEQAAALVEQEAAEIAEHNGISVEDARAKLLEDIGYVTGYLSHEQADRIMELFGTEHPIFGKGHPSMEDAYRLGKEYGERSKKKLEKA